MVYRSDVEALQARLRSLNADLAVRQRERDEVARLLRDTRNADAAVRWLEERPQRRRRRLIFFAVMAALVSLTAIVSYRTVHREREPFDDILQGISAFADKVCACPDAPCAQRVVEQMTTWSTQLVRNGAYASIPSDAQIQRITKISTRIGACVKRATNHVLPDVSRH